MKREAGRAHKKLKDRKSLYCRNVDGCRAKRHRELITREWATLGRLERATSRSRPLHPAERRRAAAHRHSLCVRIASGIDSAVARPTRSETLDRGSQSFPSGRLPFSVLLQKVGSRSCGGSDGKETTTYFSAPSREVGWPPRGGNLTSLDKCL